MFLFSIFQVFLLIAIISSKNKVEAFSNVFPTVVPNRVVKPYDGVYDFRDFIKRDAEDVYFGEEYPCEMWANKKRKK